MVTAPTAAQQAELAELDDQLREAHAAFSALETEADTAQRRWEESLGAAGQVDWVLRDQLVVHHPFDGDIAGVSTDQSITATLEDGQPHFVAGRVGAAASFDWQRFINAGNSPNLGYDDPFTLAAWINTVNRTGNVGERMT